MKGISDMSNKISVKLILELKAQGLSQNEIARTRHMSKSSVSDVYSGPHIEDHPKC